MTKKKGELSKFEEKLNDLFARISRISFVEKIFFIDHLRTMIHASLSLIESLEILGKEMESRRFKKIITEVKQEVEKGRQLSEVLSEYPKVFPHIYVKMMASGELSGKLDESLQQIVTQMKKTQELRSSIRGAMIYPTVIILAIVGAGIFMMIAILPKMLTLFSEFNAELPMATRILIKTTNFFNSPLNLILLFGGIIGAIALFIFSLKKSVEFRKIIHTINLNLPILGPIIKQINLARFSMTLSSLLKSTIPIIEAMDITADTCSNLQYQISLHKIAVEIKTGKPLSELLREYDKLYPPMVTEMVMVGERSGEVDHLLNELSDFYSSEVDKTMKNFAQIIEPVIIIILGFAVGGIAVAIIMPMYSLVEAV
ncbi:MAG: type II secretion system F family protein [bacterium]|nr:type II secretion system F family protein [bacterium]